MSHAEFAAWVLYRNETGGFNAAERMEYMLAKFMAIYANSKTDPKKSRLYGVYDFTPNLKSPPIDLETAMETWS